MNTENRTVDLVVDANVAYGMIIQVSDVVLTNGVQTGISPVDITGFTFKGSIRKELDTTSPVLENFTISIQAAADGVAIMKLSKDQTQNLSTKANPERDKYNPRVRFVGYYDVLMTRLPAAGEAISIRILEGKLYVSDGVTA